jgi:tetratricopeptide (TPR) repeat protein
MPLQQQSSSVQSADSTASDAQPAHLSAKALQLLKDGHIDEAVATQRQLVRVLTTLGGESHWQTKSDLVLLQEIERVSNFNEEQRQTYLAARQRLLDGTERRATADYDNAQALLNKALEDFSTLLGENCVSAISTLEQLGVLNSDLTKVDILNADLTKANFSKAKQYFTRATAICRTLCGEDHPAYAHGLTVVGTVCLEAQDFDEAETLFREALDRNRRVFGARSPQQANSLQNLSHVMIEKNKPLEAEAMSLQAISIAEEIQNKDPLLMAACLFNLANVNMAYGEHKNAYSNLRRSIMFYERGLPPCSLLLARVLDRYALLLRKLDRSHEAKAMEARAKAIRTQIRSATARKDETHN